jgi:hypothetical protein
MIQLGIKTDPINTRYSFEWLFEILEEEAVKYVQLGSFFELYSLEDDYFYALKEKAAARGLCIKSMFTAHRELGGFFYGDKFMEKVARQNYERFIHVASLLGVDYCGSNPGAVYRDKLHLKEKGIACYLRHLKELTHLAYEKQLKALTIEPMSCAAEPPTFPEEMDEMLGSLKAYCDQNKDTVPVYLCGDISHGYADADGSIVYSNQFLFEHGIKYMAEFHFKNTDRMYNSTFGFSPEEQARGIVNLRDLKRTISQNEAAFPVSDVVGYLEISGPKIGRDYSDATLAKTLRTSLRVLKETFAQPVPVL